MLGSDFLVLWEMGRGRGRGGPWATSTHNTLENHPPEGLVLVSSCYFDLSGICLLHLTNNSIFVITVWDLCVPTDIHVKRILSPIRNIEGP